MKEEAAEYGGNSAMHAQREILTARRQIDVKTIPSIKESEM